MARRIYDFTIDGANADWMVIETGTRRVACLDGIPQRHLSFDEAHDATELLNRIENNPPLMLLD